MVTALSKKLQQNWSRNCALAVYFLDNFALAVVYPVFTPLFFGKNGYWTFLDSNSRLLYLGMLIAAFPFAQFFGSPVIGSLADRFGRKKTFYCTLLGEITGFTLSGIAIALKAYPLLFFSRLLTGFFAGNFTVCLAVFADLYTSKRARFHGFGSLIAAGGLSFIIAISVGGLLSNHQLVTYFNPSYPFWFTAILSTINLVLVSIFFKETGVISSCKPLRHIIQICRNENYKNVRNLYLIYFLLMLAWMPALQFLSPLLWVDYKATSLDITSIFGCMGIIWLVSSAMLNRTLLEMLQAKRVMYWAMPLGAAGLVATTVPYTLTTFIVFISIATCGTALAWVNNLGLISTYTDPKQQGKVLGLNQSVGALAMMIGPFLSVFAGNHNLHLIYVISAISLLMSLLILYFKKT